MYENDGLLDKVKKLERELAEAEAAFDSLSQEDRELYKAIAKIVGYCEKRGIV
jgi:hypothetical protein